MAVTLLLLAGSVAYATRSIPPRSGVVELERMLAARGFACEGGLKKSGTRTPLDPASFIDDNQTADCTIAGQIVLLETFDKFPASRVFAWSSEDGERPGMTAGAKGFTVVGFSPAWAVWGKDWAVITTLAQARQIRASTGGNLSCGWTCP